MDGFPEIGSVWFLDDDETKPSRVICRVLSIGYRGIKIKYLDSYITKEIGVEDFYDLCDFKMKPEMVDAAWELMPSSDGLQFNVL